MQSSILKLLMLDVVICLLVIFIYPSLSSKYFGEEYWSFLKKDRVWVTLRCKKNTFSKEFKNIAVRFINEKTVLKNEKFVTEILPSSGLKDFAIELKGDWYTLEKLTKEKLISLNVINTKFKENDNSFLIVKWYKNKKKFGLICFDYRNDVICRLGKQQNDYKGKLPAIKYKEQVIKLPLDPASVDKIFSPNKFKYQIHNSEFNTEHQKLWIVAMINMFFVVFGGIYFFIRNYSCKKKTVKVID